MPTHGTLTKVYDNKGHWGLVIDVDDHGEHKLNLWDKKFAGVDSKDNPAVCDVHDWEGKRVVYTAKKGTLKDDSTTKRWPATVEEIALETPSDQQQSLEPVEPEQVHDTSELRRLASLAIKAVADLVAESERLK